MCGFIKREISTIQTFNPKSGYDLKFSISNFQSQSASSKYEVLSTFYSNIEPVGCKFILKKTTLL